MLPRRIQTRGFPSRTNLMAATSAPCGGVGVLGRPGWVASDTQRPVRPCDGDGDCCCRALVAVVTRPPSPIANGWSSTSAATSCQRFIFQHGNSGLSPYKFQLRRAIAEKVAGIEHLSVKLVFCRFCCGCAIDRSAERFRPTDQGHALRCALKVNGPMADVIVSNTCADYSEAARESDRFCGCVPRRNRNKRD
jgi:hypothetical protein